MNYENSMGDPSLLNFLIDKRLVDVEALKLYAIHHETRLSAVWGSIKRLEAQGYVRTLLSDTGVLRVEIEKAAIDVFLQKTARLAPESQGGETMSIFCLDCFTKRDFVDLEEMEREGKQVTKGRCPVCNLVIYRINGTQKKAKNKPRSKSPSQGG